MDIYISKKCPHCKKLLVVFYNNKYLIQYFNIIDVESVLKQERQAFLLDDHIFREYPGNLDMTEKHIHGDSLIHLMQWLHKAYSMIIALGIKEYVKQCMKRVQKRAYTTSQ